MAASGARPIETEGNSQKSGMSRGCGYEDRPSPGHDLAAEVVELGLAEPALEEGAGVDARRGMALEEDLVAHARRHPCPGRSG